MVILPMTPFVRTRNRPSVSSNAPSSLIFTDDSVYYAALARPPLPESTLDYGALALQMHTGILGQPLYDQRCVVGKCQMLGIETGESAHLWQPPSERLIAADYL